MFFGCEFFLGSLCLKSPKAPNRCNLARVGGLSRGIQKTPVVGGSRYVCVCFWELSKKLKDSEAILFKLPEHQILHPDPKK